MFDAQPDMTLLFDQLGLDSDEKAMDHFIETHQLPRNVMMHEAEYWSDSQRDFITSHWQKDDNWSLVIDELSELLSRESHIN